MTEKNAMNVFTVDLEEWYYTEEHTRAYRDNTYKNYRKYLHASTKKILYLLSKHGITATFFVLGKLAENEKELITEILESGHEIACHGYAHKNIDSMKPDEFRRDIEKSSRAIESAAGITPRGFRAPNFSINSKNEWAFYILKEFGFIYDSSVQPFGLHPNYGEGSYCRKYFVHDSGIIELPLSCALISKLRIPCGGGGYFRHYPYPVFRYLFEKSNIQNGSSIFYIHPWELNSLTEAWEVAGAKRYRKYHNSGKVETRLDRFMSDFKFVPMDVLLRNAKSYEKQSY